MNKKFLLLGLVLFTIFPLNFLRQVSPTLRETFDYVFDPEWVHIVAHIGLFSLIVMLVKTVFMLPARPTTIFLLVGLILLIGGLQEYFQLIFKARPFGAADLFDLGVDLFGGALGWAAANIMGNNKLGDFRKVERS